MFHFISNIRDSVILRVMDAYFDDNFSLYSAIVQPPVSLVVSATTMVARPVVYAIRLLARDISERCSNRVTRMGRYWARKLDGIVRVLRHLRALYELSPLDLFRSAIAEVFASLSDYLHRILRYLTSMPITTFIMGCKSEFAAGNLLQYVRSCLIEYFKASIPLRSGNVRSLFNSLPLTESKEKEAHTHGLSAADRNAAGRFMDRLGLSLGLEPYYISRSRSDERASRSGSRSYYWAKDLNTTPARLRVPAHALVCMVDVDQFLDMPHFLCRHLAPTCVYTFQPEHSAHVEADYSFSFDKQSIVEYAVAGGGRYFHHVWNYGIETLLCNETAWGFTYGLAAYAVDRRRSSPNREIVMLTPTGKWSGPMAHVMFSCKWLQSAVLQRLNTHHLDFTRLKTVGKLGAMISTARCGGLACATVTAAIDETIAGVARSSKYDLVLPQVMGYVEGDRTKAVLLMEYHRLCVPYKPDVVCPVEDSVRRYQFKPDDYDPSAKASLHGFMSPLVHGAFAPDRTLGNEQQGIAGRIVNVKPTKIVVTMALSALIVEFVEFVVPAGYAYSLDPVDYDEVLDRQNKPTQRATLARSEGAWPKPVTQTFNKAEAYANVKDSRIISQINGVDKRDYSMFMYAFEVILKQHEWYAIGKKPFDIARRVATMLADAKFATTTDFSRFDGHGSNLMREVERAVILRSFRRVYHDELIQLHKSQFGMTAYGMFETKYEQAYARASGSPETSIFNSLINAFVAYVALRWTKLQGVEIPPKQAFHSLGIYGGDDGLTANVDKDAYVRAAKAIGQDITVELVQRGMFGIKFLARIYSPDVWFGDTNTCCDILRQVVKFHTTVRLNSNVTPIMKLLEKVRSFILSDPDTPIIGEFCQLVLRIHGRAIDFDERCAAVSTWTARYDAESQYPNRAAEWMVAYAQQSLPGFQYDRFRAWLTQVQDLDACLRAPMFMEPIEAESKVLVAIDDDVLPRTSSALAKPESAFPPPPAAKTKTPPLPFEQYKAKRIAEGKWVDKPRKHPARNSDALNSPQVKAYLSGESTDKPYVPRPKIPSKREWKAIGPTDDVGSRINNFGQQASSSSGSSSTTASGSTRSGTMAPSSCSSSSSSTTSASSSSSGSSSSRRLSGVISPPAFDPTYAAMPAYGKRHWL